MGIKFSLNPEKDKKIPEEFKDLAKDFAEKGFITTSSENLINWARTGSLHWMTFGLACCAQLIKFSDEVVMKPFSAKSFARSLNSSGIFFSFSGFKLNFIPIPKLLFSTHK